MTEKEYKLQVFQTCEKISSVIHWIKQGKGPYIDSPRFDYKDVRYTIAPEKGKRVYLRLSLIDTKSNKVVNSVYFRKEMMDSPEVKKELHRLEQIVYKWIGFSFNVDINQAPIYKLMKKVNALRTKTSILESIAELRKYNPKLADRQLDLIQNHADEIHELNFLTDLSLMINSYKNKNK